MGKIFLAKDLRGESISTPCALYTPPSRLHLFCAGAEKLSASRIRMDLSMQSESYRCETGRRVLTGAARACLGLALRPTAERKNPLGRPLNRCKKDQWHSATGPMQPKGCALIHVVRNQSRLRELCGNISENSSQIQVWVVGRSALAFVLRCRRV